MSPIEIMALVFALMLLIKIIIVVLNPKALVKTGNAFLGKEGITKFAFLVLTIITGYYLLQKLTIVEVGAAMLFTTFLMAITFFTYWSIMVQVRKKVAKEGVGKAWLSLILWTAVALWILYTILV